MLKADPLDIDPDHMIAVRGGGGGGGGGGVGLMTTFGDLGNYVNGLSPFGF